MYRIGNAVIARRTADPSVYNQSYAMREPSGTIYCTYTVSAHPRKWARRHGGVSNHTSG